LLTQNFKQNYLNYPFLTFSRSNSSSQMGVTSQSGVLLYQQEHAAEQENANTIVDIDSSANTVSVPKLGLLSGRAVNAIDAGGGSSPTTGATSDEDEGDQQL
jgi:hypothetical protein